MGNGATDRTEKQKSAGELAPVPVNGREDQGGNATKLNVVWCACRDRPKKPDCRSCLCGQGAAGVFRPDVYHCTAVSPSLSSRFPRLPQTRLCAPKPAIAQPQ